MVQEILPFRDKGGNRCFAAGTNALKGSGFYGKFSADFAYAG